MPNIRTFDAPQLGLQPSEIGVEATAAAARRGGAFYNQASQALALTGERIGSTIRDAGNVATEYIDFQDKNKINAAVTGHMADYESAYNKALNAADPNDPAVGQNFLNGQIQPWLEKLPDIATGENGKRYAQQLAFHLSEHWTHKVAADYSTRAGEAVVLNRMATENNLISMVTNGGGTNIDEALRLSRLDAGNIPADLKPAQVARLKEHALKSEMRIVEAGIAAGRLKASDPEEYTKEMISRYPSLVNADDQMKDAVTQKRTNLAQQNAAERYQKTTADYNLHQERNDIESKYIHYDDFSGDPTVNPGYFSEVSKLTQKYRDAPSAAATVEHLHAYGEKLLAKKKGVVSDPAVLDDFNKRMYNSENPTTLIQVERATEHLNPRDQKQVSDNIKNRTNAVFDKAFSNAMSGAKQLIEGRTAAEKALSIGKYAIFSGKFMNEYQRQAIAGTLPPDALDLEKPDSLISQYIKPYQSDVAAVIRGNGGIGAAPAATPPTGEPAVSLPPLNKRVKDKDYMTPNGMMTWTGTGWRPRKTTAPLREGEL